MDLSAAGHERMSHAVLRAQREDPVPLQDFHPQAGRAAKGKAIVNLINLTEGERVAEAVGWLEHGASPELR